VQTARQSVAEIFIYGESKQRMSNQFFEQVNSIDWFSNCGNEFSIDSFPIKIQFICSVDKMEQSLTDTNWENATLEARNRLTAFLHERESRKYNDDWNKVTEIHKSNLKGIEDIAKKFATENGIGKILVDDVLWNVLGASMEDYYFPINRKIPVFFKYLMEIYSQGNIPCGIIGEIEEVFGGKQIDFSQFTLLVY